MSVTLRLRERRRLERDGSERAAMAGWCEEYNKKRRTHPLVSFAFASSPGLAFSRKIPLSPFRDPAALGPRLPPPQPYPRAATLSAAGACSPAGFRAHPQQISPLSRGSAPWRRRGSRRRTRARFIRQRGHHRRLRVRGHRSTTTVSRRSYVQLPA